MTSPESFEILARDGHPLRGILLRPEGQIRAVIQINAATGTKRSYYRPFAEFLTKNNFAVCLWDYRGAGESLVKPLRECRYKFSDYGRLDMPAVLDFLEQKFPGLPKMIIGHSVGGQQVGLMDNFHRLKALVAIGVSGGQLRYMRWSYWFVAVFYFYLFTPISHLIYGYSAGEKIGQIEALPTSLVREWRDWCEEPEYMFSPKYWGKTFPKGHFHEYNFPVSAYWASDDDIANTRSVQSYWSHVQSSEGIQIHELKPADLGVKAIDHFGYFRKKFEATLWPRILADLEKALGF